jgi:hypothetical protein
MHEVTLKEIIFENTTENYFKTVDRYVIVHELYYTILQIYTYI